MAKFARSNGFQQSRGEIGGSVSPPTQSSTRRSVLQMGAGLAAVTGLSRALVAPAVARDPISVPKAPNIIVLMTDQERHHRHWPDGWVERNLPSLQRLKRHGLYFQGAYTAACQCSPSRGLMQTGRFAPVNRVTQTFLWPVCHTRTGCRTSPRCSRKKLVTRGGGRANGI